jgi:hypothetical protein
LFSAAYGTLLQSLQSLLLRLLRLLGLLGLLRLLGTNPRPAASPCRSRLRPIGQQSLRRAPDGVDDPGLARRRRDVPLVLAEEHAGSAAPMGVRGGLDKGERAFGVCAWVWQAD